MDKHSKQALVAFVVAEHGQTLDENKLREHARDQLVGAMVPTRFIVLDALPVGSTGKLDQKALAALATEALGSGAVEPLTTATERTVAGLFASLTGHEDVGRSSDFFELGGHSLLAVRLVAGLQDALGIELPLREAFEHSSVRDLAALIDAGRFGTSRPSFERVARPEPLQLSAAQRRVWTSMSMSEVGGAYNIAGGYRLRGPLDAMRLERAFESLVMRHDALRLRVALDDGIPYLRCEESAHGAWLERDLRNSDDAESLALAIAEEAGRAEIDVCNAPLARALLLRIADEEHLLLFVFHHLAVDGLSVEQLIGELSALYAGRELPAVELDYRDAVAWQNAQEPDSAAIEARASALRGATAALALPKPERVDPVATRQLELSLDVARTTAIESAAAERGATVFILLLAAYVDVLARWTGQDDIVVGVPSAGRDVPEFEGVVGMFVRTVPVRIRVDRDASLVELVEETRSAVLDALAKPRASIEAFARASFDAAFSFELAAEGGVALPGVETTEFAVAPSVAKFPLNVLATRRGSTFDVVIEFATSRISAGTATMLRDHFERTITAIVETPEANVGSVPLLGEAAHEEMIYRRNATVRDLPTECRVHRVLEAQALQTPDAVAIEDSQHAFTYAELVEVSRRWGHHLVEVGVRPGDVVAIAAERGALYWVATLAVLQAGAAFLPIDLSHPAERRAQILRDADAKAIIGSAPGNQGVEHIALEDFPESGPTTPLDALVSADDVAYVLFTSGTTGVPKGARVTHRGMLNHALAKVEDLQLTSEDVVAQTGAKTFDISVWQAWVAWLVGGRTSVIEDDTVKDAAALVETLIDRRVSIVELVPSMLHGLLDSLEGRADPGLEPLRWMVCAGEALPPVTIRRWFERYPDTPILNAYGPTECSCDVTHHVLRSPIDAPNTPIGRPVRNCRVYLLDASLQPVPVGIAGELYIGGMGVGPGYVSRPELTAERFTPDPFFPGETMYRSGDLARYLQDGTIEFLGRVDHQVKIRGYRIELGEIEAALARLDDIAQAVVAARRTVTGGQQLVAYIVGRAGRASVSAGALREALRETLVDYMIPSRFVWLDALPLGRTGKIDRKALPEPDGSNAAPTGAEFEAPLTQPERTLAKIWSELLGVDEVGRRDSFFDLGGDSIIAIQMISRLRASGLELAASDLFRDPRLVAAASAARTTDVVVEAEQGLVTGTAPLLPAQAWFFEQEFANADHWNQSVVLQTPTGQPVNAEHLRRALNLLGERHDALRTRFTGTACGVVQDFDTPASEVPLALIGEDLDWDTAAASVQESLNLSTGHVFAAMLWTAPSPRLLLVAHHCVMDAVSWRVLVGELNEVYEALQRGQEPRLPPKTTSTKRWAEALTSWSETEEATEERRYWASPPWDDARPWPGTETDAWGSEEATARYVSRLDRETSERLTDGVPRLARCGVETLLLSALAQVGQRFAGGAIVVDVERHGRESLRSSLDVARTLGWFTAFAPTVLRGGASAAQALMNTKDAVGSVPSGGRSAGVFADLGLPRPAVAFNYLGNVTPDSNLPAFVVRGEVERLDRSPTAHRPHAVTLTVCLRDAQLEVAWDFGRTLHAEAEVRQWAEAFDASLRELSELVTLEFSPSDFPLAELDAAQLSVLRLEPASVEDVLPLSPMQRAFWSRSHLQEDRIGVEQTRLTLRGQLDEQAFARAWSALLERNPMLRTTFRATGSGPVQVVVRDAELPQQRQDLRGLTEAEQAARIEVFVGADRLHGFELDRAPLLRVSTFRTAEDRYELLLTHHHLILDGWSLPVFLDELMALYGEQRRGVPHRLAPPSVYRDYLRWLAKTPEDDARAYFGSALEGVSLPTPLVLDRVTTEARRPGHHELERRLDAAATARLEQWARRQGASLGSLLHAAWGLVLGRQGTGTDVVFGSTVSGRPETVPGVERMLGLFINVVPVRVRLDDSSPIGPWVAQVHADLTAQREHQYLPTEAIAEACGVDTALFESIVVFENYPRPDVDADLGFGVESVRARVETGYPVAFVAVPGDGLELTLAFHGDRVPFAAAERLLDELAAVLEALPGLAPEHPTGSVLESAVMPGAVFVDAGRVMRRTVDGELQDLGTTEDGLALAGGPVWPREVELALSQQPGVQAARAAAVEGQIHAAIVYDGEVDANARWRLCRGLPASLRPHALMLVEQLSSGGLPAATDADRVTARAYIAPQTQTEDAVAAAMAGLLGVDRVGADDDFFELGGQSLLAIRLISRLRSHFGIEVPASLLFQARTVRALSAELDRLEHSDDAARSFSPDDFVGAPLRRLPPQEAYPLSYYQLPERYYSELAPDSPMYNLLSCDVLLVGELDAAAVTKALQTVIDRHGVFRTYFGYVDGKPVQFVRPSYEVSFDEIYVDRTHTDPDDFLEETQRVADEYAETTFDFDNGPMFRFKLVEFPGKRHMMVFLTNHIVWDEVSSINFSAELRECYNAFRAGRQPELPELPIDYVDYASWVVDGVENDRFARQRAFWLETFADLPPPLELPLDFPRPREATFSGSSVEGIMPRGSLREALDAYIDARPGLTLSMLLHGVFALLLHRLSGQDDIVVGVPVVNRGHEYLERIIGPFATAMPLRARFGGERTFETVLADLQSHTVEALENYHYPSVLAIQEINPDWDLSRGRLFSVMYGLQHNKTQFWEDMRLDGMQTERLAHLGAVGPRFSSSRTDITLIIEEFGDDIYYSLWFNGSLFRRSTVERFSAQYLNLLEAVLIDSARPADAYPLDGATGQIRMLEECSRGRQAPLPIDEHATISSRFRAAAAASPDAVALVDEERTLTYRQLDQRSDAWAHELRRRGVEPERRVGLLFPPSHEMVVGLYAVLKADGVYVPLNPDQPTARSQAVLDQAEARLVLTTRENAEQVRALGVDAIFIDDDAPSFDGPPTPELADARKAAVVFFTSGSTGEPKGIVVEHRSTLNLIDSTQALQPAGPGDTMMLTTAYTFDPSMLELMWPLLVGARLAIPQADEAKNPTEVARLIDVHEVNVLQTVPALLGALVENRRAGKTSSLPSLRAVMCAGAVMSRALQESFAATFDCALANHYGPTEGTVDATRFDTSEPYEGETVPIGRPIANSRAYVLDERGALVPMGVSGELWLSGDLLAREYLGRPELTAERFKRDPFANDGSRMYRTGDLARWEEPGVLQFVGRADRQVKVRGNRVELEEIEHRLEALEGVLHGVVKYRPKTDSLAAWVELSPAVTDIGPVRLFSLKQRPDLKARMDALHGEAWSPFFEGDPVQQAYWPRLAVTFPHSQFALVDEDDRLLAVGNAVPLHWSGSTDDLPSGWDEGLEAAFEDRAMEPNTLFVLAGVVDSEARGRGLSRVILQSFERLASSLGLDRVLVPVRPTQKAEHSAMPIAEYADFRRPNGELSDAWLRVHERCGARCLGVAPRSQRVSATLDEWELWTGVRPVASGPFATPGCLQDPVADVEQGRVEYFDPAVWMEHPVGASRGRPALMDAGALKEALRKQLPEYMVPEHVRVLTTMPLNASGKIEAAALPPVGLEVEPRDRIIVEPKTSMQATLAELWRSRLELDVVGVQEDFFALGGNSLRAIQMLALVQEQTGTKVRLADFLRTPTIEGVEALVLGAR